MTTRDSQADRAACATSLAAVDLAGCLLEVYRATLRQDPWPQILRALASPVGADKAMFIRVDRTHPRDSVTSVMGIPEPYVAPLLNRSLQQDLTDTSWAD